MSGLARYVQILRLFDEARSEWTISGMADALEVPQSTVYRTVRELVAQQFLEASTDARYRLGAFFVEYDRLVRLTDPLHRVGASLLRDVVVQAKVPCIGVLSRLYADTVMCVADAANDSRPIRTSYERGRPRPLLRGATSKAILAHLPARQLSKLLAAEQRRAGKYPLPLSEAEFRQELAAIRKRGYAIARGEVDDGLVGIAAPILIPERGLTASLSLIAESGSLDDAIERRLVLLVVSSASLVTSEIKAPASDRQRDGGTIAHKVAR